MAVNSSQYAMQLRIKRVQTVGVDCLKTASNMENIHERVLHLRDVALGLSKTVQVNSALAPASYDCAVDSLLALYTECNQVTSLAKDKHVGRFLGKCKTNIMIIKHTCSTKIYCLAYWVSSRQMNHSPSVANSIYSAVYVCEGSPYVHVM